MKPQNDSNPDFENETPLCLQCLSPNQSTAHFCIKCGAPLTSYAATGPFESLFAEGHVYRQAAGKPRRLIVVFGIWLIFGMMALMSTFLIWNGRQSGFQYLLAGLFLLPISLVMIWKTTRAYLNRPEINDSARPENV